MTSDADEGNVASARSLLSTVLTLHVVPQGGAVWTSTLVEGLARLDIQHKSARQAILRLSADGWLVAERHGRHARLQLTAFAHQQMQRQQHIARFEAATSDREWLVLLLSIEQADRESRRRLRRTLQSFGWGNISPGAWLTYGSASQSAVLDVIGRQGLEGAATFVRAEFLGPLPIDELIARTWDLSALRLRYSAFLERFEPMKPGTDEEAFVARARLTETWIRSFRSDPFLPDAYLPADWPGSDARQLLNGRMAQWTGPADRWWKQRSGSPSTDV